jgi:hypothetical protein
MQYSMGKNMFVKPENPRMIKNFHSKRYRNETEQKTYKCFYGLILFVRNAGHKERLAEFVWRSPTPLSPLSRKTFVKSPQDLYDSIQTAFVRFHGKIFHTQNVLGDKVRALESSVASFVYYNL